MTNSESRVMIYTDGVYAGNPDRGGWGALLQHGGREMGISGSDMQATNNRMKLMAAIEALNTLKKPCRVLIHTDSRYVRKGITEWIDGWKKRDWRTAMGKPVKNTDLWKALEAAAERHDVAWHWVRAHNGDLGNERANKLAREAVPPRGE